MNYGGKLQKSNENIHGSYIKNTSFYLVQVFLFFYLFKYSFKDEKSSVKQTAP